MKKRIYRVDVGGERYLVRAKTKAQAINHIVTPKVSCAVATVEDMVELLKAGVEVEDTDAEPWRDPNTTDWVGPNGTEDVAHSG